MSHVTILGLGPSLNAYAEITKRIGGKAAFCDEVWGINAAGLVFDCDAIFHMDDFRVQEARAEAKPDSNIAKMIAEMRGTSKPIVTSRVSEGIALRYPTARAFPLEDVINELGTCYFNGTAAYAVAYAIWQKVDEISLFGADFTYPNAHHAESGRACVEFWLGRAMERGIKIHRPAETTLMDTVQSPNGAFYGYDCADIILDRTDDYVSVEFKDKAPPTADEIEARYDHSKHPNPLAQEPAS